MTNESEVNYQQFMKALGARIKEFRRQRGLTLRDMVVKHNYHDSQWRRFERSGVGNLSSLLRVAKALNISVSILLDGLGEYPAEALKRMTKSSIPAKLPSGKKSETFQAEESDIPERRSGEDRRSGQDRRNDFDRRSN